MPFFVIFIGIPLIELVIFLQVSRFIGLGTALLLCLGTAIGGGILVRHQGIQTLMSAIKTLNSGEMPSKELFDGLCIVAAGAMLITPGFLSDFIGFLLLIPLVRKGLRRWISNSMHIENIYFHSQTDGEPQQYKSQTDVIEGEYETLEDKDKP